MKRRDFGWRLIGFVVTSIACGGAIVTEGTAVPVLLLVPALVGLTLIANGKRVVQAIHAERRGHWHTVVALHAARRRASGHGDRR